MPSARYVHPEFGYFCPTPRFRRKVRVALPAWSSARSASPCCGQVHDPDDPKSPNSSSALMMTRVDGGSGAEAGSQAGPAPAAGALGLRPALSQGPKTAARKTPGPISTANVLPGKSARRGWSVCPPIARQSRQFRSGAVPPRSPVRPSRPPSIAAGPDNRKGDLSPSKSVQSAPAETAVARRRLRPSPPSRRSRRPRSRKRQRTTRTAGASATSAWNRRLHGYASVPDNRYGPFGGGFFSAFR